MVENDAVASFRFESENPILDPHVEEILGIPLLRTIDEELGMTSPKVHSKLTQITCHRKK